MAYEAYQYQPANKPTLTTDQEGEKQDLEFISLLPDEILHTILSKFRIRDAAVTTAVSKWWSPLFPTLPSLRFDELFFCNPWDPEFKWVDSLISVLNSRKTAVKKFDIEVDMRGLDAADFDPFLGVTGVEELSIFNTGDTSWYDPPLSVFNFNTIVKLEMCFCRLVVPSQLTGLQLVKSLVLTQVRVADDDLQRMISWCKAMEKLSIIDCLKVKNIVICAPSLSELVIILGWPVRVVLKSVPRLVSMAITFYSSCIGDKWADDKESNGGFGLSNSEKTFEGTNEATNFVDFLNKLRCVKDPCLNFYDRYWKMLSKDGMALPTRLSPKCYLVELKKLCLSLPLNNYDAFNMVISCLLNSSPHLMEIIIRLSTNSQVYACNYDDSPNAPQLTFWKKLLPAECVKHQLRTATFYLDGYWSEDCYVFQKFLLLNAGNLKNMNVFHTSEEGYIPEEADVEKIKNELFAIEKASPDVEIMVKPIISRNIPRF